MASPPNILILSDIHAVVGTDATDHETRSFVTTRQASGSGESDPFEKVIDALQRRSLAIDLILCTGDLTDRADPTGLAYVISRLEDLKNALNATAMAIVPGNHDIDSRFQYDDFDARARVMRLRPYLPFRDRESYLEFWAENFSVKEFGEIRVVALNSTAFHGMGPNLEEERERGRVSTFTLELLEQRLEQFGTPATINILICHHHPLRNNAVHEVDYSEMTGGHALMELLGSGRFGQWTVIHGHKHRPRLEYGPGAGNAALVLGAGSFSFRVQRDALNNSPNQFHVLSFDPTLAASIRSDHAGRVFSWNWILEAGWVPAIGEHGLPHEAGFGSRSGNVALASDVADSVKDQSFLRWSELVALHPELAAKLPADVNAVLAVLDEQHNIGSAVDSRSGERQLAVRR